MADELIKPKTFNINLIRENKIRFDKQARIFKKLRIFSFIGLLVYGVIIVGIIGGQQWYKIQLSGINQKILKEKKIIDTLKYKEESYMRVVTKLSVIKEYFQEQDKIQALINAVYQIMPEGVTVQNIDVENEETQAVAVTLRANDVFVFNSLLSRLEENVDSQIYNRVNLGNVMRSGDGTYDVRGVFVIGELPLEKENATE